MPGLGMPSIPAESPRVWEFPQRAQGVSTQCARLPFLAFIEHNMYKARRYYSNHYQPYLIVPLNSRPRVRICMWISRGCFPLDSLLYVILSTTKAPQDDRICQSVPSIIISFRRDRSEYSALLGAYMSKFCRQPMLGTFARETQILK